MLIQAVPYGHDTSNPPVKVTPTWPSAEVEGLAVSACADCHSNATRWPAYARIAPGSWLIRRDVDEGRSRLDWSEPCGELEDLRSIITSGEMPPLQYRLIHTDARLSAAERRTLADGLEAALTPLHMGECAGGD